MSELTLWVCGTPTGPKEIIRAYGTRPNPEPEPEPEPLS
jgi:hypothetical protein